MTNETTLNLRALVIGAQVAWLEWRAGYTEAYLATVSRFTPTQIVVTTTAGFTYRFRREDGRGIGGHLWGVYLRDPLDADVRQAIARARFRGSIRDIETLVRAINTTKIDPIGARTQLGRVRQLAELAMSNLFLIK